jgi:CubicO group peptidase (beta-lactamase class C family)
MRRISLQLAFTLLFTSGVLIFPSRGASQQKDELPHPKTLEELQKAMKEVVEKNHVTGAGVALVSNGELLWCGGIGKADTAANRDTACDTEFRVGSISKSFVVLALLKLQEEGKINLYARLQDIAPEIPMSNKWGASNPVRVVNVLEHSAGFDDMHFAEVYNRKDSWDFPLLKVFQKFPEPQDVRWPPGSRFSYSNPGYGIAGYLIEKTSGQPFDAYIQQNILAPLGISVGEFRLTDANRAKLAQGYAGNPQQAIPYKNIYLRPAGDMKASPGELAKLAQFFLRRGKAGDVQLLKPETIARMEYPETISSAKNGLRLGYGLANYTEEEGGVITHGHDGGIDGFISSYRYMPEQNWGYVVLLNSTVSGQALEDLNHLAIDFLSKDFPKPQQPVIPLTAGTLSNFAGYYAPRAPRSQLLAFTGELTGGTWIRAADGKLLRSGLFGKGDPLLPVGKNLFRSDKEPEATTIFFPDESGRMIYVRAGSDGEPYGEKTSPLWVYARLLLLVACVILMGSALLFALVWGLRLLFGKMKEVKHLRVRVVPVLAILCLLAAMFSIGKAVEDVGVLNFWSVVVFLATLLFVLLSLFGLFLAVSVPKTEIHSGVRIHSLLVSLACCIVTLFFSAWHLIGLRLWAA